MESIISYPNSDIPHKYDIDGTDIYGEDGQTIKTAEELTEEEIKKFFVEGDERCVG